MFIPTIIDIEASGFGRGTYPIEIGFITGTQQTGCTLIKPINTWTVWCDQAELLHGISRQLLDQNGRDIFWVAKWLNEHLRGETIYSDAWGNDMCWLGNLFEEAEICQLFKIESLVTLLTESEKEMWASVYNQIIVATDLSRHRASTDAKLIQDTYIQVKNVQKEV
jgi:hypothetical protein